MSLKQRKKPWIREKKNKATSCALTSGENFAKKMQAYRWNIGPHKVQDQLSTA